VREKDVTAFKVKYQLDNIVQLPFQPRENIHNSLGSSDIQVVILGNGQVGYTHPNKVYGAMYIGKPILYIGPKESHVADLLSDLKGNISVQHGESKILANKIELLFSKNWDEINSIGQNNLNYANNNFHPDVLKQKMIDAIVG
jgi:colanic acid biosynthesis glycosyl transferase WcaI